MAREFEKGIPIQWVPKIQSKDLIANVDDKDDDEIDDSEMIERLTSNFPYWASNLQIRKSRNT